MVFKSPITFTLFMMCVLAIKLAPLRNGGIGKSGTLTELRALALAALRACAAVPDAAGAPFVGADAEILKEDENVAWTSGPWATPRVVDYSRTFFVRTPSNEYFMFLFRPNEKPFVRHIEPRIARIKFGDRYIEPGSGGMGPGRSS
jgi:hypothetical protein